MASNSGLWFAKIFPVSICDSNVSAVVLGGNAGLDTHRKSTELQSTMRLFQSLDLKQNHHTPRLPLSLILW